MDKFYNTIRIFSTKMNRQISTGNNNIVLKSFQKHHDYYISLYIIHLNIQFPHYSPNYVNFLTIYPPSPTIPYKLTYSPHLSPNMQQSKNPSENSHIPLSHKGKSELLINTPSLITYNYK